MEYRICSRTCWGAYKILGKRLFEKSANWKIEFISEVGFFLFL